MTNKTNEPQRLYPRGMLFATVLLSINNSNSAAWNEVAKIARAAVLPLETEFTEQQVEAVFLLQQALENEFIANGASVQGTLDLMRSLLQ